MDLLRDNIWTFIGSVIAVVAVLVSIYIFIAQKSSKRLLVQLRGAIPLVSRRADGVPGITVGFNGRPLTSATVFLIRVENVGNTPILPTDFTSDLVLTFSEQSEVLAAGVHAADPPDLDLNIIQQANLAIVKPHLLNPGDYVSVRAVVEGAEEGFKASARIVGVKRLESTSTAKLLPKAVPLLGFCMMIGSLWIGGSPTEKSPFLLEAKELPALISLLIGALLVTASVVKDVFAIISRHPEGLSISLFRRR